MAGLGIRQLKHLAAALSASVCELLDVAASAEQYCEELLLNDPRRPEKPRVVLSVRGPLRDLQKKLYRHVLLPKLAPSPQSHGGVRQRDVVTNVAPHLRSFFALKVDVANFYPSIHHSRIYRLFCEPLECSPDVSRIMTRLCTYHHHLALGLITSPILADQIIKRVDRRIAGACQKEGLIYTRFVDDITLSARFDFDDCHVLKFLETILSENGFRLNRAKSSFGRLDDGLSITGVRVKRGRMDATKEYVTELDRQLDDLTSLSHGGSFDGPYYTKEQVRGRIEFVCRLNSGRRPNLMRRFRAIRWHFVQREANARQLAACRPRLTSIVNVDDSTEIGGARVI